MRSLVLGALIAAAAGLCGAALSHSDGWYNAVIARFNSKPEGQPAGNLSSPAIAGYGFAHYEPDAAFQPDAGLSNKVVFKVSSGAQDTSVTNPALEKVASTVNLYVAAGVPANKLKFVVAVNGEATPAMLDNMHYKKLYGVNNPNLPLIAALELQGIKVTVCDQALAWHHYQREWIAKRVIHTLSALTTISTLQNQGYAFVSI